MYPVSLRIVRLAYWLIRIRWYAVAGIVVAYSTAKFVLQINLLELPVFLIVLFLIILNVLSFSILKYLQNAHIRRSLKIVNGLINFQISTDFIVLTLLLHYYGGVENPFIIYYIFHMIIGSIILTTKESLLQTSFALFLVGCMTFLEYQGTLQHYPLHGFIISNMFNNLTYILCTGFIFITTSYLVVYLTRTIVTESRRHETAYLQANIKLRQKDKIKSEYVLRITHDIKGHITAIQSCITVLNKKITGPLNPQQEDFVNRANNRIKILNNFISDLLSITHRKLQQKSDKKYFNLVDSLDEVISLAEPGAQEKLIRITAHIEPTIKDLYGNQSAIEEVLMNLIMNAVKYSLPGKGVAINLKDRPDGILVEVIDHGMGIPEGELPLVFNEFYRASNVRTEIKDGTGLGLAISKQIVENHGGKIWVNSTVNLGTTFYLLLKKYK